MAVLLSKKTIGGTAFAFGNIALRRFTEAMSCAPTLGGVYSTFQGATYQGAIIEMIRAGYEQAYQKQIDEYEAGDIADNLSDDEQAELIKLFYSSIVGEPFDEYMKKLEAEVDAADKEAQKTTNDPAAQPDPNDEAPKATALPGSGAKSKKEASPAKS